MKYLKVCLIISLFICGSVVSNGQIISTVAGGATGHGGYWGDGGPATAAELGLFAGLIVDLYGDIYISDANNHRIRKVDVSTGIITTVVGTGVGGYNGDYITATVAQLNSPQCISFDQSQNLYIYDYGNNRIRKVDALTGIISTYAGNGTFGYSGDGGPATAASIDGGDMAWDAAGNLYYGGNRRIRKISPLGVISTFAGNGLSGVTIDGAPASATFIAPIRGLAFDNYGNLFCADSTASVRKIYAHSGLIYRVAGTGDNISSPYTGDGIAATTCRMSPFDISVDDTGNLYISDFANARIEKVDTFGIIQTIAGTGVAGFSGDGGLATLAKIYAPENVVLDKCNNVYIADFNNKRVRKVMFHPTCDLTLKSKLNDNLSSLKIYPNPANDELHIENGKENSTYQLCNMVGAVMERGNLKEGTNSIAVQQLPPGLYMLLLTDEEGKRTAHKIVKE